MQISTEQTEAMRMANGTIERKCLKRHNRVEGCCSPRCLRWYPRVERRAPDGSRKFDYLGGYPTRRAARAALDAALQRRAGRLAELPRDPPATPQGPTVNQLLDRWLAHIQHNGAIRLRTIGRYRQLLQHHVRPYLGERPITSLGTLHVQELYNQLARAGRKDGKPGGLHPRTIRQVHRCLQLALGYAVKWHGLPTNVATDAEPPALPTDQPTILTREQVDVLLTAAQRDSRPWLRAFTVLATATGARTGELCGLEWDDLDLGAGTVRFRQALASIDQQLATGQPRPDGRRGKLLVVGPLKSRAGQAVLSLPAFAVTALRSYQQEHEQLTRALGGRRTPVRLLLVQPGHAPRPVELDLLLRTERDTAVRPDHASRAFQTFAQGAGVQAHPHLLRHALASAMAAAKEPASIIAGQLRHADGGTLAGRTYIHQLPQTPPRVVRLIEDLYGPAARQARQEIEGR
jgi:integrase